jgi:hypothetical protein
MPDRQHPHYDDLDIINVETHHEKSDVNVRALLWTIGISLVIGVISYVAIWYMFRFLEGRQRRAALAQTPLTQMQRPADASVPKDQPLLQPFPRKEPDSDVIPPFSDTPVVDLVKLRLAEKRALSTYGWVDQQKGIVRIPIEQAKKIALQRGFPVSGGQAPSPVGRASQ